jgi:outer membrane receptor protein involved in Fe transport
MAYGLDLYSNFTYFLDDPERGDQFEQRDRRIGVGGDWRRDREVQFGERPVRLSLGTEARFEVIDNGLYHTAARQRLATTREDEIELGVVGLWSEAEVSWTPKLRTITGVRVDGWSADVTSDLALNSGRRDDVLVSPKLSVVLGPWRGAELYAHLGQGFHSNDARGATIRVDPRSLEPIERVDPLVRARAAELGLRGSIGTTWRSSVSLFGLDLDSELLYIGDAGGTEASRPSRRVGIELANSWTPRSWLRLELDLAATEARFRDDDPAGDRIPGAVDRVASLNVLINDLGRWSGGMRVRHIGPRALIEDDSVRSPSTTLIHGRLAYRMSVGASLVAEVYNLLDEEVSDIEYFYESRATPTAIPREDIHFHPAEPRSLRIGVEWRPGAR